MPASPIDELANRLKLEQARATRREESLHDELEKLYVSALSSIQKNVQIVAEVVEEESKKRSCLSEINSDAQQVASTASRLCNRVRVLDTTLRNLRSAKQFISGLEVLKDVDVELNSAVEAGDVAKGARLVTEVGKFEKLGFAQALDRGVVSRYKEFEGKLLVLLRKDLDAAVKKKDRTNVEVFVKTLFAVGLEKEAMDRFFEFVRSIFTEKCSAVSVASSEATAVHVEAVTEIFLQVADVIQKHEHFISSEFGDVHLRDFLKQIEYEANAHAVRVIRALMKSTTIAQQHILRDSSEFTVRSLDFCLEELVSVVMRCKRFGNYISQLRGGVADSSIGSLQQVLEEVGGAYVAGEQALLTCLLGKAIKEDVVDIAESSSAWTAAVDDAFFIFKKAVDRSVLTTDSNCACAVINNISNMIQVDLKEYLESSFEQSKRLFGYFCGPSMRQSDISENPLASLFKLKNDDSSQTAITSGDSLPHALGNIAIANMYLSKFKEDCLNTYDKSFSDTERRAMFLQCVSGLDLVVGELNDLHVASTKYLLQAVRGVYISPFVNVLDSMSFDVSHEGFAEMQVNDPFIHAFLASLESLVKWINRVTVPDTARIFLGILCDYISLRIEKSLLQCKSKISLLGATHLYQAVARLVAFFAESSEVGVKTKFGRLQELCSVLCLESLDEYTQVYPQGCSGGGLLASRITVKEARTLLSLRSEFSSESIVTNIIS